MSKNEILEYVEDIIYFKRHNDEESLVALRQEGRQKYVTLEDVGFAFLEVIDDLTKYTDVSQAITEVRLKAIVYSLPEEIQEEIYKKFEQAEDDLFIEEGEEIDYE